ncbi:PREDICTED: CDGSH iron-sulfur domain-containing protein NEET-like isoform X2 [Camelina sativa]|uniref:CDGSH iron-sulfur domain-containing protein NEET-like isoform X2 n=1 Tax=Camelina sativa TaxID=90675 RepID=A0ABM0X939_CAMSA|nr:PREDICTED: CDGSH iron-sulfur domain-containing protein NEET-like isoform X2 [Camelina sativa]
MATSFTHFTYLISSSYFINKSLPHRESAEVGEKREFPMAILANTFGMGVSYAGQLPFRRVTAGEVGRKQQRMAVVRAEGSGGGGGGINPEIRKNEEKVVDSVVVTELSKNITPYCRCWRSGTFPLCDGSHVKHNKANGDNVGPRFLEKRILVFYLQKLMKMEKSLWWYF